MNVVKGEKREFYVDMKIEDCQEEVVWKMSRTDKEETGAEFSHKFESRGKYSLSASLIGYDSKLLLSDVVDLYVCEPPQIIDVSNKITSLKQKFLISSDTISSKVNIQLKEETKFTCVDHQIEYDLLSNEKLWTSDKVRVISITSNDEVIQEEFVTVNKRRSSPIKVGIGIAHSNLGKSIAYNGNQLWLSLDIRYQIFKYFGAEVSLNFPDFTIESEFLSINRRPIGGGIYYTIPFIKTGSTNKSQLYIFAVDMLVYYSPFRVTEKNTRDLSTDDFGVLSLGLRPRFERTFNSNFFGITPYIKFRFLDNVFNQRLIDYGISFTYNI